MQILQYYAQLSEVKQLPALLMVVAGPHVMFAAGFWYNGVPNMEQLSYQLLLTTLHQTMETARVLHAARACVADLRTGRAADRAQFQSSLTFPWVTEIGDYSLTYDVELCSPQDQSRLLYRAKATRTKLAEGEPPSAPRDVVVKFSDTYAHDVHAHAFSVSCAPALFAHTVVAKRWQVTVMAHLGAPTWYTLRDLLEAYDKEASAGASASGAASLGSAQQDLLTTPVLQSKHITALATLLYDKYTKFRDADKAKGALVHGDLHMANIMVCVDRANGSPTDVCFIDFDWAGREKSVRYHALMNKTELEWHAEAQPQGLISAEHDLFLIKRDIMVVRDAKTPKPSPNKPTEAAAVAGAPSSARVDAASSAGSSGVRSSRSTRDGSRSTSASPASSLGD